MPRVIRGGVHILLPPEAAWDLWVDAARFTQWQTALVRVSELTGPVSEVGTTYLLDHGPKAKRQVRVVASERPMRHVIEQTGMGVQDQTVATFEPEENGTRLTLVTYAHLNPLWRFLSMLDVRKAVDKEFQRELERLAELATRVPGPARVGAVYLARSGPRRRRLTVLATDERVVHVRLHPGHLSDRDPADRVPEAPKPIGPEMNLWPLTAPLRANGDVTCAGLPFLGMDGGQGVSHLALSKTAWADAQPTEISEDPVREDDLEAVASWRARGGPVVGIDADLALTPVCTLRLGVTRSGLAEWGVAKVLRSEITTLHVALAGGRWPERPRQLRPWEVAPSFEPDASFAPSDVVSLAGRWVGHVPIHRSLRDAAIEPLGVTTLTGAELEGYRIWKSEGGGTFTTLAPFLSDASVDWEAPPAA